MTILLEFLNNRIVTVHHLQGITKGTLRTTVLDYSFEVHNDNGLFVFFVRGINNITIRPNHEESDKAVHIYMK